LIMSAFGKCEGGGRRSASRTTAPLMALVTTLNESLSAIAVDVSATGARLRGGGLPKAGADCFINLDGVIAFGTVVRADGDERGVAFDPPLDKSDERRLRQMIARAAGLPPEVRAAYDDWTLGIAR